jgi:hypothetical protein
LTSSEHDDLRVASCGASRLQIRVFVQSAPHYFFTMAKAVENFSTQRGRDTDTNSQ